MAGDFQNILHLFFVIVPSSVTRGEEKSYIEGLQKHPETERARKALADRIDGATQYRKEEYMLFKAIEKTHPEIAKNIGTDIARYQADAPKYKQAMLDLAKADKDLYRDYAGARSRVDEQDTLLTKELQALKIKGALKLPSQDFPLDAASIRMQLDADIYKKAKENGDKELRQMQQLPQNLGRNNGIAAYLASAPRMEHGDAMALPKSDFPSQPLPGNSSGARGRG